MSRDFHNSITYDINMYLAPDIITNTIARTNLQKEKVGMGIGGKDWWTIQLSTT